MKEVGKKQCVRELVLRLGLTGANMLGSGKITRLMAKVSFTTQMEIFMKDNG